MVSLSPIVPHASAQSVEERWADAYGPVQSPTAHDFAVGVMHSFGHVYTAGTAVRSGGGTEMIAFWHDGEGDPPDPVLLGQATWPDGKREATAVASTRAVDEDYTNWSLVVVAGDEMRTGWFPYSQVVISAFGDYTPSNFEHRWEYIYADDTPLIRHHTAVAIDSTVKAGQLQETRVGVLVHSHEYTYACGPNECWEPPRYSAVVLERVGSGQPYDHIADIDLGWEQVVDIRMDPGHLWVLSVGPVSSNPPTRGVRIRGYSHSDYSTPAHNVTHTISGHYMFPKRLRHLYLNDQRAGGELVAIADLMDEPEGDRDIITMRFGQGTSGWGLKWDAIFDDGGDDYCADVAAVAAGVGGGEFDPVEGIFVVGSSMSDKTRTYDYTTILYWYDPSGPSVTERWVARYDPQEADDHAFAVDATSQKFNTEPDYVAVVTGIRQNKYGHWDWLTVKYDEEQPIGVKLPIWDIHYPQDANESEEHDIPVDVVIANVGDDILSWVAGTFFRSVSGDDIGIVHYEEVP